MELLVKKIAETPDSTLSVLYVDGAHFCFVLEDGFRPAKVKHHTRIPDGTYRIGRRRTGTFFAKYHKQHGHQFVPHLLDVPGFEYILIHKGNTVANSSGCLIVGTEAGYDPKNRVYCIAAGRSSPAYLSLYALLNSALEAGQDVRITLQRDNAPPPAPAVPAISVQAPGAAAISLLLALFMFLAPALRAQIDDSSSVIVPILPYVPDTTHGILVLARSWDRAELEHRPGIAVGASFGYRKFFIDTLVCAPRPLPGEKRCRHEWREIDRRRVAWFYRKPDDDDDNR
jgi:hypothetical protein